MISIRNLHILQVIVFLLTTLLICSFAYSEIIYVDDDALNDPSPGTPIGSDPLERGSQAHPFDSIQEAIDAASDGCIIIILDGTYTGEGNRDIDFLGKSIIVKNENGPENCIIDCEYKGRGFYFHSRETLDTVVEGLKIRNGYADVGGGICCLDSSPTLKNCIFSGNVAEDRGGGMRNLDSSPKLVCCTFSRNSAKEGGAIYNLVCSSTITNCTFFQNSAQNGSALACGGFAVHPGIVELTNCILWDDGDEIWNNNGSTINITYSNVQYGQAGAYDPSKAIVWGEGNTDADPCFTFSYDCHLLPSSPCIDTGTNEPPGGLSPVDLDGNFRPLDGDRDGTSVVDMGVYEYNPNASTIALSASSLTFSFPVDGASPEAQTLFICNSGGVTLNWEVLEDCPWLSVLSTSGQLEPGEVNDVAIAVDATTLGYGCYRCKLTFSCLGAVNRFSVVTITLNVASTLYVPKQFGTIQAGIDASSVEGDIILVTDGIYTGEGNKNLDFQGKSITVRSENGPENCIIDCEHDGRGFYFHNRETMDAVVEGFTIRNGYADTGGGIYCSKSSPTIRNCIFSDNSANGGGGMENNESNPMLINCTFRGNIADSFGGGMGNYNSNPILINCIFSGNIAKGGDGGGMCNYVSSPKLFCCTFSRNSAMDNGGGIYGYVTSHTALTNCILWGNRHNGPIGELAQIYGDATVNYCCIQEITGALGGAGNIGDNPLFVDADGADNLAGTYDDNLRLLGGSPCIDAGDNSVVPSTISEDLDGNPRIMDGTVDMGAYEKANQGFILSANSIFVPKGGTNTFTIVLAMNPGGIVEVTISHVSGDPHIWIESDTLLVFDSSNYWIPQAVTLGAAEDGDYLSAPAVIRISAVGLATLEISANEPAPSLIYVDDDAPNNQVPSTPIGTDPPERGSQAYPFDNIQEAIDAASDGCIVIVLDGTYTGEGNRDIDFLGKSIIVRSESGPRNCIIDCQGSSEEYHRGFYIHRGEDANSVVDGFTITNGFTCWGGGIACDYSSPTLTNCNLVKNAACYDGEGGGINLWYSNACITNCAFISNIAGDSGGALTIAWSNPKLTNCIFIGNSTNIYGGGAINVRILASDNNPTLTNSIFWSNKAARGGDQIHCEANIPTLEGYVMGGNITVSYSDVQGGWTGEGNIDADPCFVELGYWDLNGTPEDAADDSWIEGDYHLKSEAGRWDPLSESWIIDSLTSPCIDTGEPNSDYSLEPSPNGGRINMGVYGGTSEASKSP